MEFIPEPTIAARRNAASVAANYLSSKDRAAYAKRHKLSPGCLVLMYADALEPYVRTECRASAARKADADLASRNNWTPLP